MRRILRLWYAPEPRPAFTKATVSAWRVALEERGLGSFSIIVRNVRDPQAGVEADRQRAAGAGNCRRDRSRLFVNWVIFKPPIKLTIQISHFRRSPIYSVKKRRKPYNDQIIWYLSSPNVH
jgi:hypothetical protein